MKRALFAVLPERGHVHPFLGAAAALERRGHDVSFYAPLDIRAIVAPFGLTRIHVPEGASLPAPENRGAAFAELLADRDRLRAWIRTMLVDAAEGSIAPLARVLSVVRPDVVVIDPMFYGAAIAAHEAQIPWVGLSTSLNPATREDLASELVMTLRELDPARHALFARHGMRPRFRVSDVLSPAGTFVLTTEALVDAPAADPDAPVILVGAALPPPRASSREERAVVERAEGVASGRPIVTVSFGSQAYHQPRHLRAILEAARTVDAAFVVAMGELAGSPFVSDAPPNVIAVPFVPQLELLRRSAVLVTHGGANSVHEALAHGVPMVVSPICNDQPHNAELVVRADAGRVLDLGIASMADVHIALHELLAGDSPERQNARRIAASYAKAGGAEAIAAHVMRVAG